MKSETKDKLLIMLSIIVITFLHYFTLSSKWGLHDFYRRLYYIPIILAAFRFKLKGGIISSIAVVVLYAPHLFIYFGDINIDMINQFLEAAMFIVTGFITGALVQSESKAKHLLEVQLMKLTNLENYTHNVLDSTVNGIIAVDRDLRITSANTEGKKMLGMQKNIVGESVYNFFDDSKNVENMLIEVLKYNRRIRDFETNLLGDDSSKMEVKLHISPLKNILNKAEGAVLIIEDISKIKKLENQMRRAEKLSAIGELASGIAHEIRNPLGIIKTISQTINKDIGDEETKEGLEIIESEIDRANKVIQGLLDYAKPSVFSNKEQSINELINSVLLLMNKYAQQYKVKIHYICLEDSIISVDADKLKQAFINIIFNSIQAMPSGGDINVELMHNEDWVVISFEDNGVGIKRDKLEKIFEPFYTTKEEGTGLGLSITHRIIEEHKGYIEIESEVGRGTKVYIFLPDNTDNNMVNEL